MKSNSSDRRRPSALAEGFEQQCLPIQNGWYAGALVQKKLYQVLCRPTARRSLETPSWSRNSGCIVLRAT